MASWQTIWIIGASHGIGEALVRLARLEAVTVVASARSADKLEEMAAADDGIIPLAFDVTEAGAAARAVGDLMERGLLPDLVIYNAGIYEPVDGWTVDLAQIRRHLEVNYFGAVAVLEAILPLLVERGRGHVALVASLAGYRGLPKATAYGPGKAALISLCETLKPALDDTGIEISVVNPGFVDTRLTRGNDFEMPYLMKTDDAARAMYDGLKDGGFEVAFPKPFVRRLKLARILPYSLYFKLMRRMMS